MLHLIIDFLACYDVYVILVLLEPSIFTSYLVQNNEI